MGASMRPASLTTRLCRKPTWLHMERILARTNLDAKKEIEAAILRVQQGISTNEQETAQMTGGNWRANMRQRKSEMEKMKEVGLNEQTQFPDEPEDDK